MLLEGESRDLLLTMARTTRPIVAAQLKEFIEDYLTFKRRYGDEFEQALYSESQFTGPDRAAHFICR